MATAYARPPATMTARMVVMMRPEEKRKIEERARSLDMTPSEMLRRSSIDYEPELDEALLDAVLTRMEENTAGMRHSLQEAAARLDETLAEIREARAAHDLEMQALRASLSAA